MQYEILQTAEHLPNGCTLCHTHQGPFVHLIGVKFMDVATAEGRIHVDGAIALCFGTEQELGCARQIGVTAGCLPPAEVDMLRQSAAASSAAAAAARIRVDDLAGELATARAETMRVVSVEELTKELLGDDASAAA